jgi:hypothetical protein
MSGTTKSTEQSTTNQEHKSKPATRLNHDGHKLNKATKNENCDSKAIDQILKICYKGSLVTLLLLYYTLRYWSLILNLHQNYVGRISVM